MNLEKFRQEIKIPKERVAVLIGTKGEVKKKIESKLGIELEVDSETGDVVLVGEDSLVLYETLDLIKAIGRGFSPEKAMLLFNEDYTFELLNIQDFAGKSRRKMERLKGRVIGHEGKARSMIEGLTESYISVYGKTIAFIGKMEWVAMARRAIEMLLSGSPHGNVYKWLEKKRRELNRHLMEE